MGGALHGLVKSEMPVREVGIEFIKVVWAGDKNLVSIRI